MKTKLTESQKLIKLFREALGDVSKSRYAIRVSGDDYVRYVNKLSDAIPIVKRVSDNSRVVILDRNRNNAKVVFGLKRTALLVLVKICNGTPYM